LMNEHERMVAKRGHERRIYERVGAMEAERIQMVRVRGIAPYAIDRVEGTYTVEFDRTGRSLPLSQHREVKVVAYDLLLPSGRKIRFARLADAKLHIRDAVAVGGAR